MSPRSFVTEYAWLEGGNRVKAEERIRSLADSVKAIAGEIRETTPPPQTPADFLNSFRSRWLEHFLTLFRGAVCRPPPMSRARAAALWAVLKKTALAGLEIALLSQENSDQRRMTSGLEAALTSLTAQQGEGLEALVEAFQRTSAARIEDLLVDETEGALDEDANSLLAALPDEASGRSAGGGNDDDDSDDLLNVLGERAPITCAVAWRFLLELERSRKWFAGSVKDELRRLAGDQTGDIFGFWDGMIWTASALWLSHKALIEDEARHEGKVDKRQAELNAKMHLYRLCDTLEHEADSVSKIREGQR